MPKEWAEKHRWVGSTVERAAQKTKKNYFSKTHARSCWKKYAFWLPRLWHKKVLTWDRTDKPCSVLFAILPLSHIQYLIVTKVYQAWPLNNFWRCFEVSRALQASAHMRRTRTTLTLTMITSQTTCKAPLKAHDSFLLSIFKLVKDKSKLFLKFMVLAWCGKINGLDGVSYLVRR